MIRYQADANLHGAILKGCRRLEPAIDFQSAWDAKLDGVPDLEVLARASTERRILVTLDQQTMPKHFADFLASGRTCPGVFLVRQNARIADVIETLILIWALDDESEWRDRLFTIPEAPRGEAR